MNKTELRAICDDLEIVQRNLDDTGYKRAIYTARKVLETVGEFINYHSDLALECGSEWLFQSDDGLIDSPQLVGEILDVLIGKTEE